MNEKRQTTGKRQSTKVRRQQIVEAALRIVSTKGAARLTAMEIAHEVGIADGTIFRHFKDKQEIVLAAIEYMREPLFRNFPPEHPEPIERLKMFFAQRLELIQTHPGVFRLAFSDRLEEIAGEEGVKRVRAIMETSHAFVKGCLEEAQQKGEIDPQLSAPTVMWIIMGAMHVLSAQLAGPAMATQLDPALMWPTIELMLRKTAPAKTEG